MLGNRHHQARRVRRGHITIGLVAAALAGAPAAAQPVRVDSQPILRSGAATLQAQSRQETLSTLRAAGRPGATQRVIVRLEGPLTPLQRRQLRDAGLTLLQPLGRDAFYATVRRGGIDPDAPAAGRITSAASLKPEWKLHPALAQGRPPQWARSAVEAAGEPERFYVVASLHQDAGLGAESTDLFERHGGRIISRVRAAHAVLAEIPETSLDGLAAEDAVAWIEPPLRRLSTMLDEVRPRTGVDALRAPPYELDGAGVAVMVYDGGLGLASHQDFEGRLSAGDFFLEIDHATHVSGIIGGAGVASAGQYTGMAPGVTLRTFTVESTGSGIPLFQDPGDLENNYESGVHDFGAAIVNNSIGSNTARNQFPCEITGDYGITAALIDGLVAGALGDPLRVVFANGNERGTANCGQGFATTAPPAGAKNHITVGALNSSDDSVTFFTSWGPVDDGRLKPDVSAPGCQVGGDNGVTSTSSAGVSEYIVLCGTSMAAPVVTGAGALLLEDFRRLHPGRPDFRNSTLKALLAHAAQDIANPGPDYMSGYGSIRVPAAVDLLRAGNVIETTVGQNDTAVFHIDVPSDAPAVKATIAWDDPPAAPGAAAALVNDLDLRLIDPSGAAHFPWTLDPANPAAPAVRTAPDRLNNIEQVMVEAPEPGLWRLEVEGWSVPDGPQPVSVVAGPSLVATRLEFPGGAPPLIPPGAGRELQVSFVTRNDSILAGSAMLHLDLGGGSVDPIVLSAQGDGVWTAPLPLIDCGEDIPFHVTVETELAGALSFPAGGAASPFMLQIGETFEVFRDDFESEQGWTVGGPEDTATTGIWMRVDPNGTNSSAGLPSQPEDDHTDDGSLCFVTGQGSVGGAIGEQDVDGGATTLTSPRIDLSAVRDPHIEYWRWYANDKGATPNTDVFQVDVSSDGGATWTNVETLGPAGLGTSGGWRRMSFRVADVVAPTADVRLRFIASDLGDGSIVEAAIDDVLVTGQTCAAACPADLNTDAAVDGADLGLLLLAWGGGSGDAADLNGDGVVDGADLGLLLLAWGSCG